MPYTYAYTGQYYVLYGVGRDIEMTFDKWGY